MSKTEKNILIGVAVGAVAIPVVVYGAPVVLSAVGFGNGGVMAGSSAAAWHSSIGAAVTAGSTFAQLQSAGALGGFSVKTVFLSMVAIGGSAGLATSFVATI